MFLRWIAPAFAAGLLVASPTAAAACPFCQGGGQTLSGEIEQADFILYGTLSNARPDPNGEFGKGTTDLNIELVIKPHPMVAGKKTITIPRYQPTDGKDTLVSRGGTGTEARANRNYGGNMGFTVGQSGADGEFEPAEKEILREACLVLNLTPGDFKGLA